MKTAFLACVSRRRWGAFPRALTLVAALLACRMFASSPVYAVVEYDSLDHAIARVTLVLSRDSKETVFLVGTATATAAFGRAEGSAADIDGDGLDEVQTELTSLNLTGVSSLGPVTMRLTSGTPSVGGLEETTNTKAGRLDVAPFAATGTANSFFDVFFEIEIGGQVLHNGTAKRLSGTISHKPPAPGDDLTNTGSTQLLDADNSPNSKYLTLARLSLNPGPVEVDVYNDLVWHVQLVLPGNIPELVSLSGDMVSHVFFEGPTEGDAEDDDGDGLDDVNTRTLDLALTGTSSMGTVSLHLNPSIPSLGYIQELANNTPGVLDVPPFVATGLAVGNSDVFFDLKVGGKTLHNEQPKGIGGFVHYKPPSPADLISSATRVDLLDESGEPTGFKLGPMTPSPDGGPFEIDYFPNSRMELRLKRPDGTTEIITVSGPTETDVFFESPSGLLAYDDDGDGLDEVQTRLMVMNLTGTSSLGPVTVRLNPTMPSAGLIEERVNTTEGILDVPPFAPTGTADSFFDVFFEVLVGGQVLHNAEPKHMTAVISHKPPGRGTRYENRGSVPLVNPRDQVTGFSLGHSTYWPNPGAIEVDFYNDMMWQLQLILPGNVPELVSLSGSMMSQVFFEGNHEGDAVDDDGDGLDEVHTRMVDMQLNGTSSVGPVTLRLNSEIPSTGDLRELVNGTPGLLEVPPFAATGLAVGSTDVFFEVEVGGMTLHNTQPKSLGGFVHHKPPAPGSFVSFSSTGGLLNESGEETGFKLGAMTELPYDGPFETDYFPNSVMELRLTLPGRGTEVITVSGPMKMDVFFEGPAVGFADDNDGDGLEEVQTRMMEMNLTGTSSMGPVTVRVNPLIPTVGLIEEKVNATAQTLDIPPFASTGTADSSFDMFFEVEVGGQVMHNTTAKHMDARINYKPPEPGTGYAGPQNVTLVDAQGQATGFGIGPSTYWPTPAPPENGGGCFQGGIATLSAGGPLRRSAGDLLLSASVCALLALSRRRRPRAN